MTTWGEFEAEAPELAGFGRERFEKTRVAYLATVTSQGSPRVHPVSPIIGGGRLFLFMEPTSPKGKDLERGSRYSMHSAVDGPDGASGEFAITGAADRVTDPELRGIAVEAADYDPEERYILFELTVDSATATTYEGDGPPVRRRWRVARS